MDSLLDVECSQQIKDILTKYKKTKISELLEEDLFIEYNDISLVLYFVNESFQYRNRKINEFVAYRYARTVSVNESINDFIKNVHTILGAPSDKNEKGQSQYRATNLKSDTKFSIPFSSQSVEVLMKSFELDINNYKKSNDVEKNQKEAIKNYILFEIIHPFRDGNGRTGRALFVYLQRYFSQESNNPHILHIPIARFESGTIYCTTLNGLSDICLKNLMKLLKI